MQSLTLDEIKQVLHAAADDTERLAILVTFWHGLRASELCSLTGERIQHGTVALQRLKGSLPTRQKFVSYPADPMFDEATPLRQLARQLAPNEFLFVKTVAGKRKPWSRFHFFYIFKKAVNAAGLPEDRPRNPHCLKHSLAHYMIHPCGIHVTQKRLGHKSMASTGEYLKVSDEQAADSLAAVIAAVGGL